MSTLIGDFGERFHAIITPTITQDPPQSASRENTSSQIVQKITRQQQNAGVDDRPSVIVRGLWGSPPGAHAVRADLCRRLGRPVEAEASPRAP
jgi:hypothetical protein